MVHLHALGLLASVSGLQLVAAQGASQTYAATLAGLYNMPTSTVLPFPSSTIPAPTAQAFITSGASSDGLGWSLSKGRLQNGGDNMAFVADPFPSASLAKDPDVSASAYAEPVLRITYPAGSYSNHTGGGAQFVQLWNSTSNFQSMVLSYEVAFDANFDFVKGGKLPGLRGGPDILGCSGGKQPTGSDCFSTRLMWRTNGNGEVYAYIRPVNGICDSSLVRCNDDFGISVNRGSFAFQSGTWNRITMLVRLNSPGKLASFIFIVLWGINIPSTENVANGQLQLFYNDLLALSYNGIQYRNSDRINSISGLFFSTFFGGEDSSWASPKEQHTYFRNIRMWGSDAPSNMTGNRINAASSIAVGFPVWLPISVGVMSAFAGALFVL
ncbi:unnamed protein product [Rhizoctonia solani]|uniref:Polysaccharide lyase 14 domain-containing protein n=1 Tax=Rhizoctonia solani TaxID=456999 RepID=A0A8H3HBI0_9AGAM|nr:unnamed protein product [Rhizoctonia solani]